MAPYRLARVGLIEPKGAISLRTLGAINYIPNEFQPLASFGEMVHVDGPNITIDPQQIKLPYVFSVIENDEIGVQWIGCVCDPFSTSELADMFERVVICLVDN